MRLAIIGGSMLKSLSSFRKKSMEGFHTPYGDPSDQFITGDLNGKEVVFLNRHGANHHIAPHQVNYKANLFVMKLLDVSHIVSVTAVGGITKSMSPGRWVVPDQIIDYTHGRNQTYNDYNKEPVDHIDFTWPFDIELRKHIIDSLKDANKSIKLKPRSSGTYGVTQGPRLETAAEIQRMKRDGCHLVGMTAMPEAALARELDIAYANISCVVNWAAGLNSRGGKARMGGSKGKDGQVSMDDIKKRITDADAEFSQIANAIVERV